MTANTDVLESGATAEETPYFQASVGPNGSVALFKRPDLDDMVDIDAVLPEKAGLRAIIVLGESVEEGAECRDYYIVQPEPGGMISIVACASVEAAQDVVAAAMRELVDPPPTAEYLLSPDGLQMHDRGELRIERT